MVHASRSLTDREGISRLLYARPGRLASTFRRRITLIAPELQFSCGPLSTTPIVLRRGRPHGDGRLADRLLRVPERARGRVRLRPLFYDRGRHPPLVLLPRLLPRDRGLLPQGRPSAGPPPLLP